MTAHPAGVAWPTAPQQLLLRAALSEGDEAVRAWEEWSALADLAATQKHSRELRAFRASMRRPNPARMLRVLWERHRRLGADSGSFVTYLQHHVGLERRSQLPGHVLRQLRAGRWRQSG